MIEEHMLNETVAHLRKYLTLEAARAGLPLPDFSKDDGAAEDDEREADGATEAAREQSKRTADAASLVAFMKARKAAAGVVTKGMVTRTSWGFGCTCSANFIPSAVKAGCCPGCGAAVPNA